MDIPSKYIPGQIEEKWYEYWQKNGFFSSEPDSRDPFVIVIPPPNVTGVLHMGHMLNNTIQDILVRRARMIGKNALWVPGIDHASIATEARVVAKLQSEGINKHDLTRDEFLKHAWEWKQKHGGIILEQLKKLGASCDWSRTVFTMDKEYSESVIKIFVDLYSKGKIYKGMRMVNWDPQAKTAISDEEVIYREVKSKLYYVKYFVESSTEYITVATTRPETILGDTAVCVNPADERYKCFAGKNVIVPLVNRVVPLITDTYVDIEFGTGALKITPAHDVNDYEIGIKYNLPSINIFNDDGSLSSDAQILIGMDRFDARRAAVDMLKEQGLLVKEEDYNNKIGFSERTDAVIEPRISSQWFLKMKELAEPALENVMNDSVQLHPHKFKNMYKYWMENVRDWCISRQLWWGHRIPAYYIGGTNEFVVAETENEALELAKQKTGNKKLTSEDICQDEDVLDTWFSSWLWPISVFNGITKPGNKDIKYYYPTSDLVTAPEILFFWVARMIIAGYEYMGCQPFKNVYLTGIVRDKAGRKMSKSLGNSPEPLELISKYGADGVRVGMLLCSPAGNDLLFDEALTEQGRNFGNKIWNAFRLVKQWQPDETIDKPQASIIATEWLEAKINSTITELNTLFERFKLSEALMLMYKLVWDEFSSWYLEIIKPEYGKPIDVATYNATINYFEKLMQMLHPFMPFITEEIWQRLKERKEGESIMITSNPESNLLTADVVIFDSVKEIVTKVRAIRAEKNIPMKQSLALYVSESGSKFKLGYESVIKKLCNINAVELTNEKIEGTVQFLIGTVECYLETGSVLNAEEEIVKLREELDYYKGFLKTVLKKLDNERFVNNAPENVIEVERKKKADTEHKMKILEERIASFN